MRFQRSRAIAAGGAALCLAVAGCGSSATHSSAPPTTAVPAAGTANVILTAYTDSLKAKSAKVTLHETVSTGSTSQVAVDGSGDVDLGGQEGEFSFTVPSLGTIKEEILTPELYLELPPKARAQIPGGKPWISLNVNEIAKAKIGASLSQLSSSSQAPSQTLSYLESVSDGVKQVGTPEIDGVKTTEYDATIDLTKAVASKSAQVKAAVSKLESEIHRSTLPLQVWIDGQHHVRQMSYQLSIAGSSGQTAHLALTIGLSSYGAPISITAPPASQTYDATGAALKAGTTSS